MGSGICSAAFCESAALLGKVFSDFQRAKLPQSKPDGFASSLGEGASGSPRKVPGFAKGSPFEERLPPLRGKMSRSDKQGELSSKARLRGRGSFPFPQSS